MTVPVMAVLVVLLALVSILVAAVVQARIRERTVRENPVQHLRPVDVNAFRNLIDPAEEEFLRSRLPAAEFRKIQRERLGAAVQYVYAAARNADVLLRLADPARYNADPAVVRSAQKLIDEATQLRLYAFQVIPRLYLAMLLPGRPIVPLRVAEGYEKMTQQVVALGLQYPTRGVSAGL